jgi:nucleotide-binding universal stress UspA family protein
MSDYKVLLPLDGSRYAEHALAFLPAMRHLGEVNLELLGVVDEGEFPTELPSEHEERERNLLTSYLHEVASDVQQYLGMTASVEVLRGRPADVIVEKARRSEADAIMISTHGRTGATRWRRGSVADKVVRTAHGSVLIVGPKAMERGAWLEAEAVPPFQHILVPLDGSETAERALATGKMYANAFSSQLHLVNVVKLGSRFDIVPSYSKEIMDTIIESGQQYLSAVKARSELPESVVTFADVGTPAEVLEDYISDHDIDLVVMTSHGRGGLTRAALGSTTDRLVGIGPPVMVIRGE